MGSLSFLKQIVLAEGKIHNFIYLYNFNVVSEPLYF